MTLEGTLGSGNINPPHSNKKVIGLKIPLPHLSSTEKNISLKNKAPSVK